MGRASTGHLGRGRGGVLFPGGGSWVECSEGGWRGEGKSGGVARVGLWGLAIGRPAAREGAVGVVRRGRGGWGGGVVSAESGVRSEGDGERNQ